MVFTNATNESLENLLFAAVGVVATVAGVAGIAVLQRDVSGVEALAKYGVEAMASIPVALTAGPLLIIYGVCDWLQSK